MMLDDVTGKPLLACFVFELYIKAFTNHLKDAWTRREAVKHNEIRWVIAMSADVSESGKRFIRSCVEQVFICIYSKLQDRLDYFDPLYN